ncbi:MAG: hypothetical protein JW846_01550 [Dehalococcoidia bacterium]|nr:hypothetical protein [Dehalococcoidia bacterium]
MSSISQARMYWRFISGLRTFLKEPVTPERSRQLIGQRLESRERNLLTLLKRAVYENRDSPYLRLLSLAGYEYADLERMVHSDGIEPTLRTLRKAGVYATIEEFKGKKDIIRGEKVFRFRQSDFDNPLVSRHIEASSGATRSAGTRTDYDFDFLTEGWACGDAVRFDAYGLTGVPLAMWIPIMPGSGPAWLLSLAKAGNTPVRWFSPVEKSGIQPSLRSRMATNYIVYAGKAFGARFPAPEYVAPGDAAVVARWMADTVRQSGACCLGTYTSLAVRVCQVARAEDIDINGTVFIVSGEPLTATKRSEIESAGAVPYPDYTFMEAGMVGFGCSNPNAVDEVHLAMDAVALVQYPRQVPHAGTSVDAFLFTTLLPSAPKILLNVESGDYGVVESRQCGCKLEELGFTQHVHTIRGFDKLSGEGVTFVGTDMVHIIEHLLPARFGGSSMDYQMVEEEDEKSRTRMTVRMSPDVGEVDEGEVIRTILGELGKGADGRRMMARVWSDAGTIRVLRAHPLMTERGKVLPLHIQKSQ